MIDTGIRKDTVIYKNKIETYKSFVPSFTGEMTYDLYYRPSIIKPLRLFEPSV